MNWKLIFSTATNRGTGFNRNPVNETEFAILLPASQCAHFAVNPSRYQYIDGVFSEYPGWSAEKLASELLAAAQAKGAQLQAEFANRMEEPLAYDGDTFLVDSWSIQTIKTTLDTCMYLGLTGTDPVPTRHPLQPGYWLAADTDGVARIPVPMTVARLQGLHIAGWERNTDLWGALIVHRTTLEAMVAEDATAEQIMAYDHTQGWN